MHDVRVVEERPPYLLLARGDCFAVVERRAGKFYTLHCDKREPEAMTDDGAEHAVGHAGWGDESRARRVFEDITSRYREFAETIW